jgi:hypothetical protein
LIFNLESLKLFAKHYNWYNGINALLAHHFSVDIPSAASHMGSGWELLSTRDRSSRAALWSS